MKYSLEFYRMVDNLPTVHSGHTGNLKLETETVRVWIERAWEDYGEDVEPVVVENLIDGCWVDVSEDVNAFEVLTS